MEFHFETLEDLMRDATECPEDRLGESATKNHNRQGFYGSTDWENGVYIVRHGIDVGDLDLKLTKLDNLHTDYKMKSQNDVCGAVVDMGAYLEGIPENMIDYPLVEANEFMNIVLLVNDMSWVSVDQFNNKAVGLAYLVDKLESKNVRCRVTVLSAAFVKSTKHVVSVMIKNYNESLSLGQILGCTGAAFFRRVIFRHREKHLNTSVGRTCDYSTNVELAKRLIKENEMVVLPNMMSMDTSNLKNFDLRTPQSGIDWAEYYYENRIKIC